MKRILLPLLILPIIAVAQFTNTGTVKEIDIIRNNTNSDITLDPASSVKITTLSGGKALQSGILKEVEESAVTNAELGNLTGSIENVQDSLNLKALKATTMTTTAPMLIDSGASADLSADRTLSIQQSNTTTDGYLSSTDWNIFNAKQDALPLNTNGDLLFYNTGMDRLAIGLVDQLLSVNASGLPEWIDPPPVTPTTTEGDLILRGATEDIRLAIGAADYLLTSNGTTASWQPAPVSTTLTTKGDIQTFDTANQRLAVGTDGQVLVSDSVEATGLKWIDPPSSSPLTTHGDLVLRGLTEDERLPIGTSDQLLTSNGTTASWQDAPVSTTLDTKGQLQGFDTANTSVGECSNGEYLVWDSGEATGVRCSSFLTGILNPVTDWDNNTCTSSWDTWGTTSCKSREVGDSMEFQFEITLTGTPTGNLVFNLPSGVSVDSAKYLGSNANVLWNMGTVSMDDIGGSDYHGGLRLGTSSFQVVSSATSASVVRASAVNATVPFTWVAGDSLTGKTVAFPVVGKSSGIDAVVQNKKLAKVSGAGNGGTLLTSLVTDIDFTEISDNGGYWSGTQFTATEDSRLLFDGSLLFTTTLSNKLVFAYKDTGSGFTQFQNCSHKPTTQDLMKFQCVIDLNVGDKISFRINDNATLSNHTTYHHLTITQQPENFALTGIITGAVSLDTKGQLQGFDGNNNANTDVCADGEYLVWDATTATGTKCSSFLTGTLNPVTDWQPFAPIWTTGGTQPIEGDLAKAGYYRVVGDTLEVQVEMTIGSTTNIGTGNWYFTHPNGYTADTSKTIPSGFFTLGSMSIHDSGSDVWTGNVNYAGANIIRLAVHRDSIVGAVNYISENAYVSNTLPMSWVSGDQLFFNYKIPINESSSGIDAVSQDKKVSKVYSDGNAGQTIAITTPVPFAAEVEDIKGEWNGSRFTAKEDGWYNFKGSILFSTSAARYALAVRSGTTSFSCSNDTPIDTKLSFNCDVYLAENQYVEMTARGTAGTLVNNFSFHHMSITQQPSNLALVGTFGDCQTKDTSATLGTTGIITDLTFNNIEIGKFYSVSSNFEISQTVTTSGDKYLYLVMLGLDANKNTWYMRDKLNEITRNTTTININSAKANDTSISFNLSSINNMQLASNSWVTVCEVKKGETTKW